MRVIREILLVLFCLWETTTAVSSKMDFSALANVRTDPIVTRNCLSDHVHTFYGASVPLRPDLTTAQLRSSTENSGNVEENKSLYWHPTVYKYNRNTGEYTAVPIWFGSAYYIWDRHVTSAFPPDFKMIAYSTSTHSRVEFTCDGPSACERTDGCDTDAPSDTFPQTACSELEMKIVFPACWDGTSTDSIDHMSHVAYTDDGFYDGPCPSTHPTRIPEIQFYFRIKNYEGGEHRFSTDDYAMHADYMSGWDESELQYAIDNCMQNNSTAANPDAWCQDVLTFRDLPKVTGDDNIEVKLDQIRPQSPFDPQTTVSPEDVTAITTLPRGSCTGTLLEWPIPTTTPAPTPPAPTPAPTPPAPTPAPTPPAPTPAPTPATTAAPETTDPSSSSSDSDNNTVTYAAIGVTGAIALIVLTAGIYCFLRRTRK